LIPAKGIVEKSILVSGKEPLQKRT